LDKGSDSFTFVYDGDGQRVKKTLSGGTTTYYVRGAAGETIAVYDGTGSLKVKNILSGGEAIGKIDASGNRFYYLKDHLGSIRVTVNESGSPVGYDDFYPFGKIMDGRSNNSGNSNDLYKFTGHELDQEAGLDLVHAGARNYDPELGRWLSVDPILGELRPDSLLKMRNGILLSQTPYNYTFNNPLRYLDPDGRCPEPTDKDGTICVALFIQSESAIGLKGDNRDFSYSSDPSKSRVFLHIDTENKIFSSKVNPTCSTGGDCTDPVSSNEINVDFGKDGEISVSVEAVNSRRPLLSPDIDASSIFTPDGKGGCKDSGNRDAFPSAEAYHWKNGKAATLFKRKEFTPFHLFPFKLIPGHPLPWKDRW
jgi:RHS repeat-associated protein